MFYIRILYQIFVQIQASLIVFFSITLKKVLNIKQWFIVKHQTNQNLVFTTYLRWFPGKTENIYQSVSSLKIYLENGNELKLIGTNIMFLVFIAWLLYVSCTIMLHEGVDVLTTWASKSFSLGLGSEIPFKTDSASSSWFNLYKQYAFSKSILISLKCKEYHNLLNRLIQLFNIKNKTHSQVLEKTVLCIIKHFLNISKLCNFHLPFLFIWCNAVKSWLEAWLLQKTDNFAFQCVYIFWKRLEYWKKN